MKPLKPEDLIPQASSFKLSRTGKTYHLRPISVQDEIWMRRTFGDEVEKIFRELQIEPICQIVFHQLEDKDREEFLERTLTIINEKGQKVSQVMGGVDLLMCLINGMQEKLEIVTALLETLGVSRPMVNELAGLPPEKKSQKRTQSAGGKSSTSSHMSTGGRRNTSQRGRSGK